MTMPVNIRTLCMQGSLSALLLCGLPVSAQEGRDPTMAPGAAAAVNAPVMGVEGMTVLVRDGKSYLVVGTRLYAVGDKVGIMRVERISESEVWLHDGRALVKVPRFAGIERNAVSASPATCAPHSTPAAAPCEDTQP